MHAAMRLLCIDVVVVCGVSTIVVVRRLLQIAIVAIAAVRIGRLLGVQLLVGVGTWGLLLCLSVRRLRDLCRWVHGTAAAGATVGSGAGGRSVGVGYVSRCRAGLGGGLAAIVLA